MTHSIPTTRRAFLASGLAGASIGMAGCLDRIPLLGGEQPPPFGPVEHGWGMAGRDAANTATNPQADGPTDDPDIIWEYDIGEKLPGAVVVDRILAVYGLETMHVFDLAEGERLWTASVDTEFSTPALVDGSLYVRTAETELTCFDAETGEQEWTATTEGTVRTPTVAASNVFVFDDADLLYAFDSETGHQRWQTDAGQTLLARQQLATNGETLYCGGHDALVGFDPATGAERWRVDSAPGYPTVVDGTVYTGEKKLSAHKPDGTTRWQVQNGGFPTVFGEYCVAIKWGSVRLFDILSRSMLLERHSISHQPSRAIADGRTAYVDPDDREVYIHTVDTQKMSLDLLTELPRIPGWTRGRVQLLADDMLFVGADTMLYVLAEP